MADRWYTLRWLAGRTWRTVDEPMRAVFDRLVVEGFAEWRGEQTVCRGPNNSLRRLVLRCRITEAGRLKLQKLDEQKRSAHA